MTASAKLQTQAADILATLCMQSQEGHRAVLLAVSDLRATPNEQYRFQILLDALRPPEDGALHNTDDFGVWDFKTSLMSLINALTNGPEDLEERIMLREEFARRGLHEVMTVRKLHGRAFHI